LATVTLALVACRQSHAPFANHRASHTVPGVVGAVNVTVPLVRPVPGGTFVPFRYA